MTERRQFLKAGAALAAVGPALARADERPHLWQGHDFGPGPAVSDRLDQGPFGIEQDEGWYTIATTTPDPGRVRNPGLGLVGYTWEENGPSLAARAGEETLEQSVEAARRAARSSTSSTSAATGATCRAGPAGSTSTRSGP